MIKINKKYIIKYSFEFVVIVLGISVSFWLNEISIDNQNEGERVKVLNSLKMEIQEIRNYTDEREKTWKTDLNLLNTNSSNNFKLDILNSKKNKHKFKIKIFEGKNREIRKIMNYFKFKVERLKRVEYGPLKLGELEIGKILEIKEEKVKIILKKFGISDENYFW